MSVLPPTHLTPRMLVYLRTYAANGGSWSEVARDCGVSLQTVKNSAHRAYERLDVDGAFGAFQKLGWLRIPLTSGVK